jgi:MarR family transcriptional regulator, multiple antibiotic resistance protein MarR
MGETIPPTSGGPYDAATFTRDESVGFLIGAVRARLVGSFDTALAQLGLTGAQWVTLMSIRDGAASAIDTCRVIGCDTGSMTRMLDRLEEKALLRRERSTSDKRVVNLVLTPTGAALAKRAMPLVVGVLNHYLRDFSAEEFELLKSLLRKLLANAERPAPGDLPPRP